MEFHTPLPKRLVNGSVQALIPIIIGGWPALLALFVWQAHGSWRIIALSPAIIGGLYGLFKGAAALFIYPTIRIDSAGIFLVQGLRYWKCRKTFLRWSAISAVEIRPGSEDRFLVAVLTDIPAELPIGSKANEEFVIVGLRCWSLAEDELVTALIRYSGGRYRESARQLGRHMQLSPFIEPPKRIIGEVRIWIAGWDFSAGASELIDGDFLQPSQQRNLRKNRFSKAAETVEPSAVNALAWEPKEWLRETAGGRIQSFIFCSLVTGAALACSWLWEIHMKGIPRFAAIPVGLLGVYMLLTTVPFAFLASSSLRIDSSGITFFPDAIKLKPIYVAWNSLKSVAVYQYSIAIQPKDEDVKIGLPRSKNGDFLIRLRGISEHDVRAALVCHAGSIYRAGLQERHL
jgi:hypothetical protein